ncbi:SDR family NAD(P)-dependent oxidoreductase [Marinobacter zhanjiangensis]|uniref:3-oxoacyl-ACP reductase n=1 Tax=Marinobacter zhanjiangensis TaxID=578215 RepID=A0ABQ3AJZ6_9GAMM|nr:SDR family NAD(P)-dependent oxidoreductase [Marinobacter zhanjiangensis]GGY59261.1 3-oxoacyl-ACP reductase [Marinobacter zhanjiangensis]
MYGITELSRSLKGSRALVTGAASGMGRATAAVFASEGARGAVTDYDADGARSVAEELTNAGYQAQAWHLDVSDLQAIRNVVAEVEKAFGGLDVLINNAGISGFAAIDDDQYDTVWDRCLSVLLTAQQQMIRAALPALRQSSHPRIVNIASTEALGATAQDSAYAAAKAGVSGLTRALAVELGPEGITVNCICPGPIDTAMTAFIEPEHKQVFAKRRTALRRYGLPEEVAHVTVSLCLPASSYLTGTVIPVDGGLMARNA